MSMLTVTALLAAAVFPGDPPPQAAPFDLEALDGLLADGRLDDAAAGLEALLAARPDEDAARFGLAWTQVLQAAERLATGAYELGLGDPVNSSELLALAGIVLPPVPGHFDPPLVSHADLRALGARWLADLDVALTTLDAVDDPDVALTLTPGRFAIRPVDDEPVPVLSILRQDTLMDEQASSLRVRFDRADVHWLTGYCHALSMPMRVLLAVDTEPMFDVAAHLLVARPDTASARFQEGEGDGMFSDLTDVVALIHTARLPVTDPEGMGAALAHAEALFDASRAMWSAVDAERDDDHEWIPSVRQTGPLATRIEAEQLEAWQELMADAEALFAGETLLPFWRGGYDDHGVNLRRVFTEPRSLDPILWFQGSAALPYLEEGDVTPLGDEITWRELQRIFGGNLLGFALWVN